MTIILYQDPNWQDYGEEANTCEDMFGWTIV